MEIQIDVWMGLNNHSFPVNERSIINLTSRLFAIYSKTEGLVIIGVTGSCTSAQVNQRSNLPVYSLLSPALLFIANRIPTNHGIP